LSGIFRITCGYLAVFKVLGGLEAKHLENKMFDKESFFINLHYPIS